MLPHLVQLLRKGAFPPRSCYRFPVWGTQLQRQVTNCYILGHFFISKTLCQRLLEMSCQARSHLRFNMRNMSSMKKSNTIKPTVCHSLHGLGSQSHDNNSREIPRAEKAPAKPHSQRVEGPGLYQNLPDPTSRSILHIPYAPCHHRVTQLGCPP